MLLSPRELKPGSLVLKFLIMRLQAAVFFVFEGLLNVLGKGTLPPSGRIKYSPRLEAKTSGRSEGVGFGCFHLAFSLLALA